MARPLHSADAVHRLESELADRGLDGATLMARAGAVLLRELRSHWPQARRILILVGPGNNGGDGYVLAQLLRQRAEVEVQLIALAPARAETAAAAAKAWQATGGQIGQWRPDTGLPEADLIVDGLFGIGLSRPPDGAAAALIAAVNAHPAPVLAIDLPSGLDGDRAAAIGAVVQAHCTVTLLARKRGLYTGAALEHVGRLVFDALDVDDPSADTDAGLALQEAVDLVTLLPPRRRGAHKGDHGHVLVIGGDTGMAGAARITASAALRAGAGWTSLATRAAHAVMAGLDRPELMVHAVETVADLQPAIARADVIAIGPGLGQHAWGRHLLAAVLEQDRPLLLDADALNLLANDRRPLPSDCILTPHPGEAARLLDCSTVEIERDRYAAVRALAQRYNCVVVLKGAGSLIDDGRRCRVCAFGNPGMASAGMGDALTGIVAALRAQGLSAFDAACAGVLAHALAGDAAARSGGERGLLANDLIATLRAIINP